MKELKSKKEWFVQVKFMKLMENQVGNYIPVMVPKVIMKDRKKTSEYIKKEVVSACEMFVIKRWLESGYDPGEVFYVTKKQSDRVEALINGIKTEIENSKGGLVVKSEPDYEQLESEVRKYEEKKKNIY